ncbi:MAG: rhamnan synthesis F family protein [Lachnospiraceae bacterium]
MILEKNSSNRLLIYFFYDGQGIVDEYIIYLLNEMDKYIKDMVIVSDGKIKQKEKEKLELFTDYILEQEFKGADIWAYRAAIEYIGWKKLEEYDEVILMGCSLMGPIYPLKEMFVKMSSRNIDYWGLTKFYETTSDSYSSLPCSSFIPEHIPTHFIVARKSLIMSNTFHDYWNNMEKECDTPEKVGEYGVSFTVKMDKQNFSRDVYINTDEYRTRSYQPMINLGKQLIAERRCPFFNRNTFMREYTNVLIESCGQEALELYRYLDKYTDYNMDLFWDNILRTGNQADIKKALQLNFILPSERKLEYNVPKQPKKIALIMHIYFMDLVEECFRYAQSMPQYADLYITTNTQEKKEAIEQIFKRHDWHKFDIRVTPNRGRDVGPFLVESRKYIMEYDYICHTHDKKVGQLKPGEIGASFSYWCFENVLRTPEFVENVLRTFEENPRMGLLTPPPPNHGSYYITLGLEWGLNYQSVCKLSEKLGIHLEMVDNREPIAPLGSVFWARTAALKKIFDYPWEYAEFPEEPIEEDGTLLHAIERIYNYSAQAEGYYPGWILSENGASIEITNMHHMLRTLNQELFFKAQIAGSYQEVLYGITGKINEGQIDFQHDCNGKLYVQQGGKEKIVGTFCCTAQTDKGVFCWIFQGMKRLEKIQKITFESGEKGNVVWKELSILIEYNNGQTEQFSLETVDHNGIKINSSLVFISSSPQIIIKLKENSGIKEVIVNSRVEYGMSSEVEEIIKGKFTKKSMFKR